MMVESGTATFPTGLRDEQETVASEITADNRAAVVHRTGDSPYRDSGVNKKKAEGRDVLPGPERGQRLP